MMSFIGAYWRGEKPLWKSFFLTLLYGILLIVLPPLIWINLLSDHYKLADTSLSLWMACFFLVYYGTLLLWAVAVWRSSRISSKFWQILAKTIVLVVLIQQAIGTFNLIAIISENGFKCLIDIECMKKVVKEENGN